MRDRKLQISVSIGSLLYILAVLAWLCGVMYTSFAASDYAGRSFGTTDEMVSVIFFGLMLTILSGGALYGLACVVSLIERIKLSQTGPDEPKPSSTDEAAP